MKKNSISDKKLIDRLESFMKHYDLNDNQLTVKAGLSIGMIGKARKSRAAMNSDSIEKILLSFPGLNADWLLTGRGDMFINEDTSSMQSFLTNKIKELEEEVRTLTKENGRLEAQLEIYKETNQSNPRSKAI